MCHALAWLAVSAGTLSSLFLAWSVRRHPEKMGVMNWVWPLVGLPGGPLAVWLYLRHRRPGPTPAWLSIATATCHCGAGCTLGDILSEGGLLLGGITLGLGAVWTIDTVVAFLLGIVFQYFSIAPMRGLGFRAGIIAAVKADTLSLMAWQAGMIGMMAAVQLGVARLESNSVEFWFAMQAAMLAGFAVSYPVNGWLLKSGLKEKM